MAVIFFDGFDYYSTTAELTRYGTPWNSISYINLSAPNTGVGYNNTRRCLTYDGSSPPANSYIASKYFADKETVIVGYHLLFYVSAYASSSYKILDFRNSLNVSIGSININLSTKKFDIYVSSTLIGSSNLSISIVNNRWYNIQCKYKCSVSNGSIELKLNNYKVFNISGINTNPVNSGLISRVVLSPGSYVFKMDDVYVLDDTGPAPLNDFLGSCIVQTLAPTSLGSPSEFTPSQGSNHLTLVNENPPSDSTYLIGTDLNQIESFKYTGVYGTDHKCISVHNVGSSLSGSIITVVKSPDGTTYKESNKTQLITNVQSSRHYIDTDVYDQPWTTANIQNSEFGIKVGIGV